MEFFLVRSFSEFFIHHMDSGYLLQFWMNSTLFVCALVLNGSIRWLNIALLLLVDWYNIATLSRSSAFIRAQSALYAHNVINIIKTETDL